MGKHRRQQPRYQREAERPNRIVADPKQQAPNNSYGPPLYYEDITFTCRDCGSAEVWTAEQQKWWYEVAKGAIFSRAIRCRTCREKRLEAHGGTPRKSHAERQEGGATD